MQRIQQEMNDLINRSLDSHIRVAVTGLSRAGKTAFITSLVNQLLHTSTHDNLPLLNAARDKRIVGAKRVPQHNMMVPRFAYDEAMTQLCANPPQWPSATRDVSEIRLAIKYNSTRRSKRFFGQTSTLHLDIIDYPGEWLLDLPLLDLTFEQWSTQQLNLLKDRRLALAQPWLDALALFDAKKNANEQELAILAEKYTNYLYACKENGLHWVQPGRFVLPGELSGAPVLQFFPCLNPFDEENVNKQSHYTMLKKRYEEYKNKVVHHFYKEHFSTFDRQIVLIDCLTPLNEGHDSFLDMQQALEQIMHSFRYGRGGLLQRLFFPKIDKLLFAATKADHVTPEQHPALLSLLQQMVHPAWKNTAYDDIDMECICMASIQATQPGFINSGDKTVTALQGVTLAGDSQLVFPGDVPPNLPNKAYWQKETFEFTAFRPCSMTYDQPFPHIRLDKAINYLIGDKLR